VSLECQLPENSTHGTPIAANTPMGLLGAELVEGGPALVDHGAVALARAGGEVGAAHRAQAGTVGAAQPRVVDGQQNVLANHRGEVDLAVLDREGVVVLGWLLGVTLIHVDDERLIERTKAAPALPLPRHLDRPSESDVVERRNEFDVDGQLAGDRVVKRVDVQRCDRGRNGATKSRPSEQLGSVDAKKAGGHDTQFAAPVDGRLSVLVEEALRRVLDLVLAGVRRERTDRQTLTAGIDRLLQLVEEDLEASEALVEKVLGLVA
jgi:hypothetical protein